MYNPLGTDDENTYYEQYNTVCSGVIKTGDFVYVVTDGGKQMIAQVDTIWETAEYVFLIVARSKNKQTLQLYKISSCPRHTHLPPSFIVH